MKKVNYRQALGMVDISQKNMTIRRAVAQATIKMSRESLKILLKGEVPKGNVLETARVAGILAAKSTPQLIPMCHPLALSKVKIDFDIQEKSAMITIKAEVVVEGKTGVEMEALAAASVSALTIYDMMKFADKEMVISDVMLLEKQGGKSGDYKRY